MAMKNTEKADMKYTNQRVEILAFLREHEGHPNVDEVYEGVRKKLTRISKATVYKNLKFLTEKGLLEEVNVKGVSRFEANFIHTIISFAESVEAWRILIRNNCWIIL